jgi:hypothetical protein
MLAYKVQIKNLPELQARFRQAPSITAKHVLTAGNKSLISLQGTAKGLAPVDTSRLRQSIQVSPMRRSGNRLSGSVGTGVKYAEAQETGTGIYGPRKRPITAKSGKYLTFKTKDGRWVRTKSVKGVRGRFYMKGAVERNQGKINNYFEQAAVSIARELST